MDAIAGASGDTDVAELTGPIRTSHEEAGAVVVAGCNGIPTVDDGQIVDDGRRIDHVGFEAIADIVNRS